MLLYGVLSMRLHVSDLLCPLVLCTRDSRIVFLFCCYESNFLFDLIIAPIMDNIFLLTSTFSLPIRFCIIGGKYLFFILSNL